MAVLVEPSGRVRWGGGGAVRTGPQQLCPSRRAPLGVCTAPRFPLRPAATRCPQCRARAAVCCPSLTRWARERPPSSHALEYYPMHGFTPRLGVLSPRRKGPVGRDADSARLGAYLVGDTENKRGRKASTDTHVQGPHPQEMVGQI